MSVVLPSLPHRPAEDRAAVSPRVEGPHTIRTGNDSFTCSQHSPALHPDSAPAALWERRASTTVHSNRFFLSSSSLSTVIHDILFFSLLFVNFSYYASQVSCPTGPERCENPSQFQTQITLELCEHTHSADPKNRSVCNRDGKRKSQVQLFLFVFFSHLHKKKKQ